MATYIKRKTGWLAQIRRKGHDTICRTFGSPYKSMQVVFYQRVTGMGVTNKYLQVNAALVNPVDL